MKGTERSTYTGMFPFLDLHAQLLEDEMTERGALTWCQFVLGGVLLGVTDMWAGMGE